LGSLFINYFSGVYSDIQKMEMKKEITTGQLLSACATILVAVIAGIFSFNSQISEEKAKVKNLEIRMDKFENKMDVNQNQILQKIDVLVSVVNEIKVDNAKRK